MCQFHVGGECLMCGLCEAARHSFMQMHREELNTTASQQKPRRSVFFQSAKSFCVAHAAIVHYDQNIHVKCVKHLQIISSSVNN